MRLEGKVALVTGASRGIGRASAVSLAEEGAAVAVGFNTDKDAALETAGQCREGFPVQIDVSDPESVASAFDEIEKALGKVSVLVNNAGITRDKLLLRMTEQDWAEVLDIDLGGVFRCTKRALPGMLSDRWGRIVTVGSAVGQAGNRGQSNYAAAKAGAIGFTKSVAREVASHGITANVVAPGLVDTDLTSTLSDQARSALIERIPLGRSATPEEVAEAVRFCATSPYLTGQVISLDGGLT
jgi:3-oxoacyl-[acyl-carrier protein] reductase